MTAAEAFGCQACGLPITPCLVCASSLPVLRVDDPLIKTCRSCGVVNPLDDKYREVLDIPPTSALPSAMTRRAQIARVGRRPYILAKHAHFMYLSSVVKRKGEDDQDEGSESDGLAVQEIFAQLGPKGSPVPEIYASAEEGHPLTFLPYMHDTGARAHQEAVRLGRKALDARRFYSFSDSESLVKRMRLSLRQEVVDVGEKNLNGSLYSINQVQMPLCNGGSAAAVSNGRASSTCTPLKHDSANPGESTRNLAAGLGLTAERPVQSSDCYIPVNTNYKFNPRPIAGHADDGEVRSIAAGEEISVPLDGLLETLHDVVEHRVGVTNQFATSDSLEPYLQSIPSTIAGLEVSKSDLENAERHEGRVEAPTSRATVLNGSVDQRCKYFEHDFYSDVNIGNPDQLPRTSMQKVDVEEVDAYEREGNNENPVGDVTGSEEVPTRRHEGVCSECGQTGGGCRSSSNVDEAELMRCCTQILELHCPHTLKADMRTPCAYPLCCPVPIFPLPAGNFTASSKVCRSYVTQFTVDALRAAHSTLISSTQESTSEEVASPLCGMEQALSMVERFIEIKDRMVHVQGLIQQVDAASTQASRDFKAYGDRGAFPLASQQLRRLLSREKQQNVHLAKNDVQVMTTFLQDINKLLTACFHYVGKMLEASLCSVGDNCADSNAMNLNVFMLDFDSKPGLEAVRTAVPLWFRLYHDVAHASGLLKC